MRIVALILPCAFLISGCVLLRPAERLPPLEMVRIPGGVFVMGDVFDNRDPDATPAHTVEIAPFYLTRYEITFAEFDAFADVAGLAKPDDSGFLRENRAVVNITWDEALAFCSLHGARLPTEPEWEYAARGAGLEERFAGTDSLETLDQYARHFGNSGAHYTMFVGTKKPNRIGLFDMSGNAAEWIGDYYPLYPEQGGEPTWSKHEERSLRITRGGSFRDAPDRAQTFRRIAVPHDIRSSKIGFRCARPAEVTKRRRFLF